MAKFLLSGWNISKWASLSSIKSNTKAVAGLCKSVLSPISNIEIDNSSFDDVMKKEGVSEQDLKNKIKMTTVMVSVYLGLGVLLLGYSFYLFCHFPVLAGLTTATFSILMLSYAFREHLFLFNMRRRQLNCTVYQWFKATFLGK